MRRLSFCLIFIALICGNAYAAENTAGMSAVDSPYIVQAVGETAVSMGPARYPSFYQYTSDNPACGDYLAAEYADPSDDTNGVADTGLTNAPIWLKSKYGSGSGAGSKLQYQGILSKSVDIPEMYRKAANVLVTWTVRVEATPPEAYTIWPALCTPWHGTSNQGFLGGLVKTCLFIDGVAVGQEATMTIPASPTSYSTITISDPTITGSCLLQSADFAGGVIPATVHLEIRWLNDTSMNLASPAYMRSMVVLVLSTNS